MSFNRRCPPGTLLTVLLRDGSTRLGTLRAPAIVWSGLALVEMEGLPGYWTIQALRTPPAALMPTVSMQCAPMLPSSPEPRAGS